tara:strand:+ start:145158 stop:145892 length:735 start_codon:yes stop_codon:yes gene_type:complete
MKTTQLIFLILSTFFVPVTFGNTDSVQCIEERSIQFDLIKKPANRLYNGHEEVIETLPKLVYWCDGQYVQKNLDKISYFLRDRTSSGGVHAINPKLLDVVYEIFNELSYTGSIRVVSGYRSAKSQKKLRKSGNYTAARNSTHTSGGALDFYVPGYTNLGKNKDCTNCRQQFYKAALRVLERHQIGGLGAYCGPSLHVDVRAGNARSKGDNRSIVRRWGASMSILDGTRKPSNKERDIGMPKSCL